MIRFYILKSRDALESKLQAINNAWEESQWENIGQPDHQEQVSTPYTSAIEHPEGGQWAIPSDDFVDQFFSTEPETLPSDWITEA